MNYKFFPFLMAFAVITGSAYSQLVSTPAELQNAISAAVPGSEIILANQAWANVEIDINVSATSEQPVIIRAESTGAVFFEGNSSVNLGGAYIIFKGVVFRNPSGLISNSGRINPIIEFRSSGTAYNNCTVTNIKIDSYNGTEAQSSHVFKWIYMVGQNNEVSYSSFLGKYGVGSIINDNRNNGGANYIKIHHNYFAERVPVGAFNALNDQDAIRLGTSSTSMSDSYSQVYNNYFNNWFGEIEIISNKSGQNKYYNNTFRNYSGTLTLRHGNNCEVYNNYFFANNNYYSGGVRVIGEGHKIYNNYIEGINSKKEGGSTSGATGGINITNGRVDSELNGYFQVIGATIVNNTFVNCDYGIRVGTKLNSTLTLPPVDLDISNNIMLNSSSKAISENTAPLASQYQGNITQNGAWDIPTGTNGNEVSASGLLELGTLFYRLPVGSAAVDAGLGSYSFLTNDILGGARMDLDAGAEEYGANGDDLPYTDSDIGVSVGFGANVSGKIPPELSASVTSLTFDEQARSQIFNVLSNLNWSIASNAEWITINPVSGSNSSEITITVTENTLLANRVDTLTISDEADSVNLKIAIIQTPDYVTVVGAPKLPIVAITGVGTQEPNIPENTIDNNDATRWSGESSDGSSYITYDLWHLYDIAAVRIKFHKGDERSSSFKVRVSDGTNNQSTDILSSTGNTLAFEGFEFSPRLEGVRYLTLEGYGNSGGTDWNSYIEVEIYGELSTVLSIKEKNDSASAIAVYPNPVKGNKLTIHSKINNINHVQLFDLAGNLLIDEKAQIPKKTIVIDVSQLPPGMYIIVIPGVGKQKVSITGADF